MAEKCSKRLESGYVPLSVPEIVEVFEAAK
jgi:hypothetical protein